MASLTAIPSANPDGALAFFGYFRSVTGNHPGRVWQHTRDAFLVFPERSVVIKFDVAREMAFSLAPRRRGKQFG
jgi:hypothetical protein